MPVQDGAYARLTMLGRHVGSGLMAADMAVMLAQKRQESLARAEALAPRLSLPVKTLTAHRCEHNPQHHAISQQTFDAWRSVLLLPQCRAHSVHKLTAGTFGQSALGTLKARTCQIEQV